MDVTADLDQVFAQLLLTANQLLGLSARSLDQLLDDLLPPKMALLQRLAVRYEKEMLACRDGKAYFSACVLAAAMLESLLLLLCLLNRVAVEKTDRYKSRTSKRTATFDQVICCFGFDDLIEISAELDWIPVSLISDDWKKALPEAFKEIAKDRRPNMSREDRERKAASLVLNPAYSLMLLLNVMRNRVHPGRWIRHKHLLTDEEAFAGWAQALVVGAAHIRDCLLRRHQQDLAALLARLATQRMYDKMQRKS